MEIKTKEYPENSEVVVSEITFNYSQINKDNENLDDILKITTKSVGDGFYFIMQTERWAFDDIDCLIKILQDFKNKAKI